MDIARHIIYSL